MWSDAICTLKVFHVHLFTFKQEKCLVVNEWLKRREKQACSWLNEMCWCVYLQYKDATSMCFVSCWKWKTELHNIETLQMLIDFEKSLKLYFSQTFQRKPVGFCHKRLHCDCTNNVCIEETWTIDLSKNTQKWIFTKIMKMLFRQIFWCHRNLTCKVTKLMVIDYWTTNCARINWNATSKIEMTIFYSINAKRVVRRHLAALNRLLTGSNQREIAHHHLSCIANCVHAALSVLVACHRDNDDNGELRSTWEWASYIRPILIVSISKWHFCW